MKKAAKSIDVLLPSYNGGRYIEKQIESILAQRDVELKLYIQDDCSDDCTISKLDQFQHDSRVRILKNDKNVGLKNNLNSLATYSSSPYIALADQDDIWNPNKLRLLVDQMKENDCLLVFSDLQLIDYRAQTLHESKFILTNTPPKASQSFASSLIKSPFTGCTFLIDRRLLKQVFPIPENVAIHDKWIGCFASLLQKTSYVLEPLTYYRQHETNVTGSFSFGARGFIQRIRKQSQGNLRDYLNYRASHRMEICKALLQRVPASCLSNENISEINVLLQMYSKKRINFSIRYAYLKILQRSSREIGTLNVLIEFALTSLYRALK